MTTRRRLEIDIPPPQRHAIAAHFGTTTAATDNARRQSKRMREYRNSLIMRVVTGQLDVRTVAQQIR